MGVTADYNLAVGWSEWAAELGSVPANTWMGKAWLNTGKSFDNAIPYLRFAGDAGDPAANYLLGDLYARGVQGVAYNLALSIERFEKAAQEGDASAAGRLAQAYYFGEGKPQDFSQSARLARQALAGGQPRGATLLALLYRAGAGVAKDDAEALQYMKIAASKGDAGAVAELAAGFPGKGPAALAAAPMSPEKRATLMKQIALAPAYERAVEGFARFSASRVKPSQAEINDLVKEQTHFEKTNAMLQKDRAEYDRERKKIVWPLIVRLAEAEMFGDGVPANVEYASTLMREALYAGQTSVGDQAAWSCFQRVRAGYPGGMADENTASALRSCVQLAYKMANTPTATYLYALSLYASEVNDRRTLMKTAADAGVVDAQLEMAMMLWQGQGGAADIAEGNRYLDMAAKTDANAKYLLGAAYEYGLFNHAEDRSKARELYGAAAAAGQSNAVARLMTMPS